MPRAATRKKNIGDGTDNPPGTHGGGTARIKTGKTTGVVVMSEFQLLSAPRQNVNISNGPITAVGATGFANLVCRSLAKAPGLGSDTQWMYDQLSAYFGGAPTI